MVDANLPPGAGGPRRGAPPRPPPPPGGAAPPARRGAGKGTAPRAESDKQRAARQVQGSYIGLLRKFSPKEKLAYKRIAKEKGVPEAVAAMKKKLGRV
jgi:hypothetical protein